MAAGDNNGRVTNARLEAKLDGIAAKLDDFIAVHVTAKGRCPHNRRPDEQPRR